MKSAEPSARTIWPRQREVALRELTDCLLDAYDFVSRRAYENFMSRGGVSLAESEALREDWLHAESEIVGRLDVQLENSREYVSALATLPGFTAAEVEVGVESRWLVILGSRKSGAAGSREESGRAPERIEYLPEPATDVYLRRDAAGESQVCAADGHGNLPRQVFSVVELPAEVDTAKCRAVMACGLLGVLMPKKNSPSI